MAKKRPVRTEQVYHAGSIEAIPQGARVLIAPQEGPQEDLMFLTEKEILFGGAKGGGKTAGARIWALKGNPDEDQSIPVNISYVYHPGYRCLVLRKNYKDMMDYIDKSKDIYGPAFGAVWYDDGYFEFPSGAKIVVGHMADEKAYMQYMGQEWTRIIIEEVTQIGSKNLYLRVISCARTIFPEMKVQILLTANPEGPGFYWVRQRFMTHPKTGKKVEPKTRIEEEVFNPFTHKTEIVTRIFLPSKVSDNKILMESDPGYVAMLLSLPTNLRQAYLDGNWDVLGGKYFHNFRPAGPMQGEPEWANHVVESNSVWRMPWHRKWCGLDIGFNHWMVCHWFFESQDDERIYVYRTLRTRFMGMYAFGELWAKKALQDFENGSESAITVWMSHDAFHKRDSSPEARDISPVARFAAGAESILGANSIFLPTQEEMPSQPDFWERLETQRGIKVVIRKAPMHRESSSSTVRELLDWNMPQLNADTYDDEYAKEILAQENGGIKYLEYMRRHIVAARQPNLPKVRIFGDMCPDLIRGIEDAVYDEDKINIAKVDCNPDTGEGGDDDLQAFIYGLSGYRKQVVNTLPPEARMQKRVHDIMSRYNYQLDGSQRMQIQWQAYLEANKPNKLKSAHIPRRSSRWSEKNSNPIDGYKDLIN